MILTSVGMLQHMEYAALFIAIDLSVKILTVMSCPSIQFFLNFIFSITLL